MGATKQRPSGLLVTAYSAFDREALLIKMAQDLLAYLHLPVPVHLLQNYLATHFLHLLDLPYLLSRKSQELAG